eukprot:EG_transcript_10230
MHCLKEDGQVYISDVKSEPIIGTGRHWGVNLQDGVNRFASVGLIQPKYRRLRPNNLLGKVLFEYDRNQSAHLTACTADTVNDEAQDHAFPPAEHKKFSSASIIFAWICLLFGVTATSCVGSFIQKMPKANGLIKTIWFGEGFSLLLVVIMLTSSLAQRLNLLPESCRPRPLDTGYVFSALGVGLLLLAGVGAGIGTGCFTVSLDYTTVGQSYLFSSLHPQLILFFRIIQMLPVFWEEVLGILFALAGGALVFYGSRSASSGGKDVPLGDALALVLSVSTGAGLLISKFLLPHMSSIHYLLLTIPTALLVQLLAAALLLRDELSLFGPTGGIFSFLDETNFRWWLGCMVCAGPAQFAIMFSLGVLSPIVVSIMVTVQPILATAIQVLVLRAGAWPPPLSLLGYLVLAAGSLLVCWASQYHMVQDQVEVHSECEDEDSPREGC